MSKILICEVQFNHNYILMWFMKQENWNNPGPVTIQKKKNPYHEIMEGSISFSSYLQKGWKTSKN